MNLLEHIGDHLDFAGLGILNTDKSAGNIYWGRMPDAPDEALAVMAVNSGVPGSAEGARIQIFTRGKAGDVRTPYEWALHISDALHEFRGFLHGDGPRAEITVMKGAEGEGIDSSGRHYVVLTLRVRYCDMEEG